MNVEEQVQQLQQELVTLRRDFHTHPEQSWQEFGTQEKILNYLEKLGIPAVKAAKTGVIGTIKGKKASDKILGIRADIDALPITELNETSYKSQNPGTMHACGHDTHITILLGTAKILAGLKDELPVTVRLIFQPAEEYIADSGAAHMKNEPLVKECDRIIALHIWGLIPVGYASLRVGPVMSAADTFDIYVEGKGGHGAQPHQAIDPIVAASEFVTTLQTVVSREISALEPAVLSVTSFQAGTTSNVIPAEAHLQGTARTFNPQLRQEYPGILERVARGVGEASRTQIRVDYHFGTPPMINDKACVETGLKACQKVFDPAKIVEWDLQMGGEDFAKYEAPKCILLLGGGVPDEKERHAQHNPYFDVDERALGLGVQYFVQYVLCYGAETQNSK
ncbi:amidohydrolase [Acidaminococcus sp. NSJ-142]|jgi:amidohydrolase|uniref:M20 metallopeptidase family protein n=1 Tax=Acidaminococcus TaxID=904 RepID=UPI000CF94446|nr:MULTISPECIES: amidohydrolase [Acidaminococcus]MCD2436182.1 amidohydrolase [Acidaminococcus hominis]MCH4097029.1 amidohydrolase [Acidaminococcus provencensis]RHK01712.1 amidohydrolase [Acidaminococcus sp. AM05-11]